ncbi:CidA/LrgA family protein [Vibrio profundi]|uniref:CidA/LrgA family protein n=1 Tax=Vibrio profundi TaxID=1774960 RepID=UPI003736C3EC
MKDKLHIALRYLVSFGLILIALWLGNGIQTVLGTSIPGSIFGMLILFGLMSLRIIPVEWVKPSANLIIRYMILLFVPISVGLMEHADMLIANALPIMASAVGGSLIVLVSLAWFLERHLSKRNS